MGSPCHPSQRESLSPRGGSALDLAVPGRVLAVCARIFCEADTAVSELNRRNVAQRWGARKPIRLAREVAERADECGHGLPGRPCSGLRIRRLGVRIPPGAPALRLVNPPLLQPIEDHGCPQAVIGSHSGSQCPGEQVRDVVRVERSADLAGKISPWSSHASPTAIRSAA